MSWLDAALDGAPTWDGALCAQADPDEWFPEQGASSKHAKAICGDCPLRAECLKFALDRRIPFGIWGGLSAVERRQLLPRAPGPARLTHCQRAGHDWSIPENVRVRPDGSRYCAECTRIGVNARRKRKREAAA